MSTNGKTKSKTYFFVLCCALEWTGRWVMRKNALWLWCLLLCAGQVRGQQAIDSLRQLLLDLNDHRQRVDVLLDLSTRLYDVDVAEGYKYASDARDESATMKYERGERLALILIAYRYVCSGDFRQAIETYEQSDALASTQDDILAYSYASRGNVYRSLAQYDSSRYLYTQATKVLEKHPNSRYLAYAYKNLGRLEVILWHNKDAEFYYRKALSIYESENRASGQAELWFLLSEVSKNLTDYDQAAKFQLKGCGIADSNDSEYLTLVCHRNRGDYYYHLGEYLKSLDELFKALDILRVRDQPQVLAGLYNQLGEVYDALGQYDVSLEYYLDALKIWERMGVKYEMAKLFSEIGWIYKNQLNFAQAKAYMERSLTLRQEIKDEHGISNSYNVLGVLYYQEKRYDKALDYLNRSLEIRTRIGHREGVSACIFNMAAVYEDLGQLDKALDYQFQALEIDERIGNKQGLSISYNQIGQLYTKTHNFPEALKFLLKSRELARETGSKNLIMTNRLILSKYYEEKGDYKAALQYHRSYADINDSIYSEGNAMKLAEMQALYQMEQKDQQIELLNQNKVIQMDQIKLQRAQIGQQRIIIIGGLVGLILVCIFAYKTYQYTLRMRRANYEIFEQKEEIQAQSEELIEANQTIASINRDLEEKIGARTLDLRQAYKELDTFFYRSSHDFRRPITTFLGLAEVAKITVKDPNALELFAKVRETASNLDKMLVKLQSISDVGTQQLVYKEVMLKEIVDSVLDGFKNELTRGGLKVTTSVDLNTSFFSYPAMIRIIVENLVENSIAFASMLDPSIDIRAYGMSDNVIIKVQDNGQGIDPTLQGKVFDMYFRGNERSKGNGLGLYIVKKAVQKLNGSIELTSSIGGGSTFKIVLPNSLMGMEN
ncbi:MAG TPA: tetratricopeptide repeat-containing sensor histidine kinase [Chryseolinea sp.]|nr:tetratricopeptide repeat-containing sensor histidine kinase [Chryseolinea sp.]